MGGMGYSSTSAKDINGKLGGYVGGLYDIELNKSWYVQPPVAGFLRSEQKLKMQIRWAINLLSVGIPSRCRYLHRINSI